MTRHNRLQVAGVALVALLLAYPAHAQSAPNAKNIGAIITTGSSKVLAQDDLGLGLRDYLLIQCTGGANCYCCIGTNNACTSTNGTLLTALGGSWLLVPVTRANGVVVPVPIGDVSCLAATGTSTVSILDY